MKKIRSYTSIWNVEKVLYAINGCNLPFPVTFTQISWFVLTFIIVLLFGNFPPFSLVEGVLYKNLCIPIGTAWFMSQKTFDGKKPYSYVKTMLLYVLRSKTTYAGKAVKLKRIEVKKAITAVRSEVYVPY